MEKATKITLWSLLGLAVVSIAGGTVWYFKNKKDSENTDTGNGNKSTGDNSGGGNNSGNTNSGSGNSGGNASSGGGTSSGGGSNSTTTNVKTILDELLANMGASAKKSQDGSYVNAAFNSSHNSATFYGNGRFAIGFTGTSKTPIKGYWSNGGKTLLPDGGTSITSGSVWQNLLNAIK